MAKYTSKGIKATKAMAKAEKNNFYSNLTQRFVKEAISEFDGTQRQKSLKFLLKRMQTQGDDFQRLHGVGEWAEGIIGIYAGVYRTKKDIMNYKVFDQIPFWQEGDMVLKKGFKNSKGKFEPVHIQAKGFGGSVKILPEAHLVLDEKGNVIREESLYSVLSEYVKKSPPNLRIAAPIDQNATVGFFDLGVLTFLGLAKRYPKSFYFDISKKSELFSKTTDELIADAKSGTTAHAMAQLVFIAQSNFGKEQKDLDKMLRDSIYEIRKAMWIESGSLRFNYSPTVLGKNMNPLINTGIRKGENLKPFYTVLKRLYGAKKGESTYFSNSFPTRGNKDPEFYYSNTYANVEY